MIQQADLALAVGVDVNIHPVVHGLLRRACLKNGLKAAWIGPLGGLDEEAYKHLNITGPDLEKLLLILQEKDHFRFRSGRRSVGRPR